MIVCSPRLETGNVQGIKFFQVERRFLRIDYSVFLISPRSFPPRKIIWSHFQRKPTHTYISLIWFFFGDRRDSFLSPLVIPGIVQKQIGMAGLRFPPFLRFPASKAKQLRHCGVLYKSTCTPTPPPATLPPPPAVDRTMSLPFLARPSSLLLLVLLLLGAHGQIPGMPPIPGGIPGMPGGRATGDEMVFFLLSIPVNAMTIQMKVSSLLGSRRWTAFLRPPPPRSMTRSHWPEMGRRFGTVKRLWTKGKKER